MSHDNSEDREFSDSLRNEAEKLGISTNPKQEEVSEEDEELETEEKVESEEEETESKESSSKESEKSEEEEETEDESDEETESEDEEFEEESSEKKPKRYIPIKKFQSEKAAWRVKEQSFLSTIATLEKENGELASKIPNTPSPERTKLYEQLKAADPDFDPKNLDVVIDTIKAELGKGGKVSAELEEKVNALTEFYESQKQANLKASDDKFFEQSWSGLVKTEFSKDFPNVSDEQKEAARKFMDKIWHTKEFHDKDIEYVYWKNKAALQGIISPRKKGLETGQSQGHTPTKDGKPTKLSSSPTAKELKAAEDALRAASYSESDFEEHESNLE